MPVSPAGRSLHEAGKQQRIVMKSRRHTEARLEGNLRANESAKSANTQALRNAATQALLVLGMHRSGTSALTRVLSCLGADLPKNILGPGPTNEAGHWESQDLIDLHEDF